VDEDELVDYEQQVRRSVAADLRTILDQLHATLTAVYVVTAGSTRHKLPPHAQETIRRHLLDALDRIQAGTSYARTRATLRGAARSAIAAGGEGTGLGVPIGPTTPLDIRAALTALTAGMRGDLLTAGRLARHGRLERYGDVVGVIMAARKALNRAERTAAWTVHRAHNEGVRRAVDKAWSQGVDVSRMWRSERSACVRCAGFNGALAAVGDDFLPVVDVADFSGGHGPAAGPPLHPWCKCSEEPWFGPVSDEELTPLDLPYALRREAQRAIATGQAQGSEPARLRAAGRLVGLDDLLIPKTVRKRAAGAVAAGTFDR
jgi:hypothetical protein